MNYKLKYSGARLNIQENDDSTCHKNGSSLAQKVKRQEDLGVVI